jgi:hypothetical protein
LTKQIYNYFKNAPIKKNFCDKIILEFGKNRGKNFKDIISGNNNNKNNIISNISHYFSFQNRERSMNQLSNVIESLFYTLKDKSSDFRSKFIALLICGCHGIGKSTFVIYIIYI